MLPGASAARSPTEREVAVGGDRLARVPAPAVFVISAISQYLGASLAVQVFDQVSPSGVAWLRVAVAALCLIVVFRPSIRGWSRRRVVVAVVFGLVTLAMNVSFYEAIARLPLGTAVALEFLGPVSVAAIGSRSRRDVLGLLVALVGVLLIADVRLSGSPLGVALALLAGAMWAAYIVVGKRVADVSGGADGLAIGLLGATVIAAPMAGLTTPVWSSWQLILFVVGAGVLSSALPYSLDQLVMRRMGRAGFALLLAILPATAAIVGFAVLQQVPKLFEAVGIVLVILAVWLSQSRWKQDPPPLS